MIALALVGGAFVATLDPRRIAVEGTSTGGGMTLALKLRLKEAFGEFTRFFDAPLAQ